MLTPKQYKLLCFINNKIKENGTSPSFDEMKDAIGLKSKSGIHALIEALEERGFIRKMAHKARALEVIKMPKLKPSSIIAEEKKREEALASSSVEIPLYGKIAAGTPIEAIANEVERVAVPFEMVGRGVYYALTVEGDSMIDAGILDGDTVIIKNTPIARNGDIVVALLDDTEATLKEYQQREQKVLLVPKNKAYQTRTVSVDRVKVQGILAGLLRNYH
ncbi:MAG: transcriptional repressor LexA [Alphaproteobacteria bacterium]